MLDLLMNNAHAQEAAAAGQQSPLGAMMPFVIIMGIFYFLMIRPQKKKLQAEQSFINSLTKGQEVYTKAGILGTVSGLTDKIVTLEVAEGTKMKVLRSQVGGLTSKLFEKKETPAKK